MERIVFDIEADGLLEESENIWCISYKNLETTEVNTLYGPSLNKYKISALFKDKIVIGHNIIKYDIPMLKKFYKLDLIDTLENENIIDTYLMSKVLYPDRPMPKNCPTSILNPVTNRSKKIGPHGLESWAWRVGERKLAIHDWREFTPEIIQRCEGDVIINEKVYYKLLKEANLKEL